MAQQPSHTAARDLPDPEEAQDVVLFCRHGSTCMAGLHVSSNNLLLGNRSAPSMMRGMPHDILPLTKLKGPSQQSRARCLTSLTARLAEYVRRSIAGLKQGMGQLSLRSAR